MHVLIHAWRLIFISLYTYVYIYMYVYRHAITMCTGMRLQCVQACEHRHAAAMWRFVFAGGASLFAMAGAQSRQVKGERPQLKISGDDENQRE